jgi:hypothetical protein
MRVNATCQKPYVRLDIIPAFAPKINKKEHSELPSFL